MLFLLDDQSLLLVYVLLFLALMKNVNMCVCVSVCRCVCMNASGVGRYDDVRELTINQEENIKNFQRKNGRLE